MVLSTIVFYRLLFAFSFHRLKTASSLHLEHLRLSLHSVSLIGFFQRAIPSHKNTRPTECFWFGIGIFEDSWQPIPLCNSTLLPLAICWLCRCKPIWICTKAGNTLQPQVVVQCPLPPTESLATEFQFPSFSLSSFRISFPKSLWLFFGKWLIFPWVWQLSI